MSMVEVRSETSGLTICACTIPTSPCTLKLLISALSLSPSSTAASSSTTALSAPRRR